MTESQYTKVMVAYAVILVLSYGLFLVSSGTTQKWALITALCTAVAGLFRALQRPYQAKKEKVDEESNS